MANLRSIDAMNAYGKVAGSVTGQGSFSPSAAGKIPTGAGSFENVLGGMVQETAAATGKSETMSMKALAKQADLVDVVTAATNAEMTVQTVVAIRDKVIQAYNDILRMPI